MKKPNVIFLCTHNQGRSQMAEAFLKKYGGEHFNVFSAGFEKAEIHPYTKIVMEEKGINLKNHYSKELKELFGEKDFEIIITICSKGEKLCPTLPLVSTQLFWHIEDPASFEGGKEEKLDKFREVRNIIEEKVKNWLNERELLE